MACRSTNYPHDLLGVSETLQPDYPNINIPPDHGWSTFSAMTHYLQEGLHYQELLRVCSLQIFEELQLDQYSIQPFLQSDGV